MDIVKKYHIKKLIYLGDDTTDVDAFKQITELRKTHEVQAESVAVCSSEMSQDVYETADYTLKNVDEVEKFFNWLLN